MTSALVYLNGPLASRQLVEDLAAAGIEVLAVTTDRSKLVQDAVRHAPDLVIGEDSAPSEALFRVLQTLAETAPCAVLLFTPDPDAGHIIRSTESGVHAYVVNGYAAHRVRPLVQLAQARFKREQALHDELKDVSSRLEERKSVDRAKGILMRARQLSDDDAFQILRTASMHTNQRLGQVSERIIQSARLAEAVNRAGQLRMLSQRLVKLYVLRLAGVRDVGTQDPLQTSIAHVESNLTLLGKNLSQPTFGDLLAQVVQSWRAFKELLGREPAVAHIVQVDVLAEALLQHAERLTDNLEHAGPVAPLKVLNMAGRQRMLSQRFAKYALLKAFVRSTDAETTRRYQAGEAESRAAFEQAQKYLNDIPLTAPDIRHVLEEADAGWQHLLAGAAKAAQPAGRDSLARASENLLDTFEQLSAQYERSMQMLVG